MAFYRTDFYQNLPTPGDRADAFDQWLASQRGPVHPVIQRVVEKSRQGRYDAEQEMMLWGPWARFLEILKIRNLRWWHLHGGPCRQVTHITHTPRARGWGWAAVIGLAMLLAPIFS
ncbi:hypothetical protein BJI67_12865 [Acidihalobacter aeolianus]|uniref:Uncharacterized protein n=2 Tax=Acidihalobacter TaxID=1765964 RepID=A0A1D8KA17_9GAMM|nr:MULTISPECIES: hypothetical protein [Acidihalobacter]AOV17823.1 hypothetical protein BJI67_12865 [Acidihalobacter aeolianus]OBS10263.1 hypothetical protein Thpro_021313 [Acidihalobacter prosperus]